MMRKLSWLIMLMLISACTEMPAGISELIPTDWQSQLFSTYMDECPTCQPFPTTAIATSTSFLATLTNTPEPIITETPIATKTAQATSTSTSQSTGTNNQPSASSTVPNMQTTTSTQTLVPTTQPSNTFTPKPTITMTKTITPISVTKMFEIQQSSPVYMQNFVHSSAGCDWLGVAGQVFDMSGNQVKNLVVVVEGVLSSESFEGLALTGMSNSYGPGGYEIVLGNKPINSSNSVFIELYDLAGESLTNSFALNTFAECNKNLIIINFQQIKN